MSLFKWVLVVLGLLVVAIAGGASLLIGPRNLIGMWRYDQRREGTLEVGEPAPDVELIALDGVSAVHLRDSIGEKPLVIIFGSYT